MEKVTNDFKITRDCRAEWLQRPNHTNFKGENRQYYEQWWYEFPYAPYKTYDLIAKEVTE